MTEYAGYPGRDKIIKNADIVVAREKELTTCKSVFNLFWKANVNIIYVVNDRGGFEGIITDKSLLSQLQKKEQEKPYVNKKCVVIQKKEGEELFREAWKLLEKYHITTAIPVLDDNGHICCEVRRNDSEEKTKIVAKFRDKISKYKKSYYLRDEVFCLKRILESQELVVLGTREKFKEIFGCLCLDEARIHYMTEPVDAYEFMKQNGKVMIDMCSVGYKGREDIYRYCRNGYLWSQFINYIYKVIEFEYCSKVRRILDNEHVTLEDFLRKYMQKEMIISERSIFTAHIISYLKSKHFAIVDQKGVCRDNLQYDMMMNGIELKKEIGDNDEWTSIYFVDLILQLYMINRELKGRAKVINFVFDREAEVVNEERNRMEGTSLKNKWEYGTLYSLGKNKYKEYLDELGKFLCFECVRSFENDRVLFKDMDSGLVHIENGIRRTCFQPEEHDGTIYFLGACTMWGVSVEDEDTIPSMIQSKINALGKRYCVINLANNMMNASRLLNSLDIQDNDIFIILFPFITDDIKSKIDVIEIGDRFNVLRKNKYKGVECFSNMVQHCGINGNVIYSEILFEELRKHLTERPDNVLRKRQVHSLFRANYRDLDLMYNYNVFKTKLQQRGKKCLADRHKKVGGIVMNCNPFTLGHRYLVEYALRRVDCLYVFVVEEDRSYFSFQDRYEMVERGTEDLENVVVIGSGNMVISSVTFSAYFNKQKNPNGEFEPVSMDLRIFGQYIAPIVGIQYRFIGQEPIDLVTAQYNVKMKEILPEFGIEVIEIPRKCMAGKVISATSVRELYKKRDFESMAPLVPETTLKYLCEKAAVYGKHVKEA